MPPFSGGRTRSTSAETAEEGERRTPPRESEGLDLDAAAPAGEGGGEFLPGFLEDDEPWTQASDDTAIGMEAETRSQPDVEEPDPWSAAGEDPAPSPVAPGQDQEEDVAAPDASLEEAAHRAADRLDGIARRLRATGGDPQALLGVGRDDPLALLVVGFVMGELHGR